MLILYIIIIIIIIINNNIYINIITIVRHNPWYSTRVVNFGEIGRAQLVKSTLLTSTLVARDLLDILRSVRMLKRERESGAESNG